MIIPIVFATDDNYVLPLCVAIKSLIDSKNKKDDLYIYIFYSNLKQESFDILNRVVNNKAKISFVCVDEYTKGANFYVNDKVTIATYYRFFAPVILSQYRKILYLDCDILVQNSLAEFYDCDLTNYIIGSPIHLDDDGNKQNYFNAGIMIINVEEYNKRDTCQKCVDFLNKNRNLPFLDETVLNEICKDNVKFLPHKYNFQTWYAMGERTLIATGIKKIKDIVIIHYSTKPWRVSNCVMADIWWKKAKKLPREIYTQIKAKYNKLPKEQSYDYYKFYFASPLKKFFIKINKKNRLR